MKAMCILSGAGIRPGVKIPTVNNTSIAPTIAKLLGLEYSIPDDKPLTQALMESSDSP
jgi:hypothetical protein